MKSYLLHILLFVFIPEITYSQSTPKVNFQVDRVFRKLAQNAIANKHMRRDTSPLPILTSNKNYTVVLADSAYPFIVSRRFERNPFGSGKFPLCFSIIYDKYLVALFEPGQFACYDPDTWRRNKALENRLNTKRFERHWLIGNKLTALSGGRYWQYDPVKGWLPYNNVVPFKNRPKLFEDQQFLVYNDCNGEFGGHIYFFDKQTKKTYYTSSTCAVWVRSTAEGYRVLSSLGHMIGHAAETTIADPRRLPEWTPETGKQLRTVNEKDTSHVVFNYYGIQVFGGAEVNSQVFYILHTNDTPCLATLSNNTFTVVHPLVNYRFYTHDPITARYGNDYLINLDFYGIGGDREVACLLIRDNRIIFLNWQEFHAYP